MGSDIIIRLRNNGNGRDVHTANKCASYIAMAEKHGKDDVKHDLTKMAEAALKTGDWKPLKKKMMGWW